MNQLLQFLIRSDTDYSCPYFIGGGKSGDYSWFQQGRVLVNPLPGKGSTGHMAMSNLSGMGAYNSPLGRAVSMVENNAIYHSGEVGHRGPLCPVDSDTFLPLFL